jgi:NADPH:quinone reductase-like Zn-dependent oxidoreductase
MKEAIVHPTPTLHTTIHDVPIPTPGPNEIVIKVIVAGSNVKGTSIPSSFPLPPYPTTKKFPQTGTTLPLKKYP